MVKCNVLSSKFKNKFHIFWANFELQTTLASQVEARFGPDLDQIWDQKFSTSVWKQKISTAGTSFNFVLEGGDFSAIIYYLSLHHKKNWGTKTKWKIFVFCLRGSKNIFQIFGANFELQITLASQVKARFGPNLEPFFSSLTRK